MVYIQNDSGYGVDRLGVLGISGVVIDQATNAGEDDDHSDFGLAYLPSDEGSSGSLGSSGGELILLVAYGEKAKVTVCDASSGGSS